MLIIIPRLVFTLFLISAITACGQKGPLEVERPTQTQQQEAAKTR